MARFILKTITKKGKNMEICGMPLINALQLLLNNSFSENEKVKRLKIKKEIAQSMKGKREEATMVVNEIVGVLKSIRDKFHHYAEIGIADLLSLINSKTESLKKTFAPEAEKQIRWVISWEEWNNFPPESSVHIFRQ